MVATVKEEVSSSTVAARLPASPHSADWTDRHPGWFSRKGVSV
jgi:hypothetical protein